MTFWKWSTTAATNGTADSTCPFPEGMDPAALNDGARGQMAALAKYRDDTTGAIVTGGTSTAYTVTSYQVFDTLAHMSGQVVAFTPHATNGATVTLNVDGLGAKPLRSAPSVELLAGVLIQGTPYVAIYNNSDSAFYLQSFYGNPYNVPIGSGLDFWGATAPNSSFAFPFGQAISRTTYAGLFAVINTQYGIGDGSTTFNLPDKRGRASAALDNMGGSAASRLTSTYFGTPATSLGAVGGSESRALITGNLPPYTPSGGVSVSGTIPYSSTNLNVSIGATSLAQNSSTTAITASATFTGTAQGGSSLPFGITQPTIICNYIMRVA